MFEVFTSIMKSSADTNLNAKDVFLNERVTAECSSAMTLIPHPAKYMNCVEADLNVQLNLNE